MMVPLPRPPSALGLLLALPALAQQQGDTQRPASNADRSATIALAVLSACLLLISIALATYVRLLRSRIRVLHAKLQQEQGLPLTHLESTRSSELSEVTTPTSGSTMAPSTDRNLCVSPGQSSQRSSRLSDSIPVASAAVQTAIDRLGLRNSVKPRELKSSSLTLLNKLGSGKFGVVFKALMLEEASGLPNYMVAVKLLQKNSHSFKQRSDFLLEGVLLAQFHHQNVLNLLGQVSLGGDLMLVTPYCEFGALNSFLSEHSHEVPLCALVGVCADIASGMAYVHALEIIHCDLSARNVLVAADYQCKISDFGLARHLPTSKMIPTAAAAPISNQVAVRWASPEVLTGQHYSMASDAWSFGIVTYEVFTFGGKPFASWTNEEVWKNVAANTFEIEQPSSCPDALFRMMSLCLQYDVDQRPKFEYLDGVLKEVCLCIVQNAASDALREFDPHPPESPRSVLLLCQNENDLLKRFLLPSASSDSISEMVEPSVQPWDLARQKSPFPEPRVDLPITQHSRLQPAASNLQEPSERVMPAPRSRGTLVTFGAFSSERQIPSELTESSEKVLPDSTASLPSSNSRQLGFTPASLLPGVQDPAFLDEVEPSEASPDTPGPVSSSTLTWCSISLDSRVTARQPSVDDVRGENDPPREAPGSVVWSPYSPALPRLTFFMSLPSTPVTRLRSQLLASESDSPDAAQPASHPRGLPLDEDLTPACDTPREAELLGGSSLGDVSKTFTEDKDLEEWIPPIPHRKNSVRDGSQFRTRRQTAGKVAPLASTSSKRLSAVTRDSFHMFSRRHRHLESIVLSDSQLYAGASREDRKDLYLSLVGADGVVVRARDAIPVPEAVLPELEGRSATAHAKTIHNSEDESGVC
eukprot:m.769631 g.769631  ORF g.769631 m.769631 type:complete len:870 (-) comp59079_c0_seq60:4-2613(-)